MPSNDRPLIEPILDNFFVAMLEQIEQLCGQHSELHHVVSNIFYELSGRTDNRIETIFHSNTLKCGTPPRLGYIIRDCKSREDFKIIKSIFGLDPGEDSVIVRSLDQPGTIMEINAAELGDYEYTGQFLKEPF